jgi:hypothetical protein
MVSRLMALTVELSITIPSFAGWVVFGLYFLKFNNLVWISIFQSSGILSNKKTNSVIFNNFN